MSENGRNQGEREGWDAKVEGCCRGGEIPAYRAPDPPGRRSVSRGSPPASADALDLRVLPLPLSPISDFRGR